MSEEDYLARREAALLTLEAAAGIWLQFTTNPPDQMVVAPNVTFKPLSALSAALDDLPGDIENLLQTTIATMDSLPAIPENE